MFVSGCLWAFEKTLFIWESLSCLGARAIECKLLGCADADSMFLKSKWLSCIDLLALFV
jgi:hypothetical protein